MMVAGDMQLTEHFKLSEFTRSDVAKAKGIDNSIVQGEVLANITEVAIVLERVRKIFGGRPVNISSGVRCLKLNRAMKSKDTSAHLKGLAVDFNITGLTAREVALKLAPLVEELDIDQLIYEIRGSATWVHMGLRVFGSRHQVLTIRIEGGTEHVTTGVV